MRKFTEFRNKQKEWRDDAANRRDKQTTLICTKCKEEKLGSE